IRGPGWGLVVKEDWKELTAPIRGLSWIGSGAALILVLLLLLLSQVLCRRIVSPIKRLELQVDQISSGLDLRIDVGKAPKEIENLAENVSQMVEKVKEKDQELMRYEQDWSRTLTETAHALIVAIDLQGRISFFNREAEKKLGYRKEDVLGKEVEVLFSSPLKEEARNFFSHLDLSQIPPTSTFPLITSSKESILVEWAINVIREKDGSPKTIVGIGIDITEREARLRRLDLLNKINQEIIVSDLENLTPMAQKIREVLDAHTVLIIRTDEERKKMIPIGWNWRPGYYGIPDEVLVQKIPQTTEKGLIGYCIREGEPIISGDAERDPRAYHIEETEYMDESVIAMPLRFQEEVLGAIFVGKKGLNQFKEEDVALVETIAGSLAVALHNREVMESLKEEEERFRNLFTSIPDGVVIYDSQGTILEVNEALARSRGYTREELIGRNVEDLDHPESKPLSKPFLEEVQEKGAARREFLNITKTGETIPTEVFASRILYQGKTAFIGVSRDISERKKLEQLKSDLLYAISHEMKTPIQSLMAAVDIYSALPPVRLATRSQELFEIINRNILRLKQLVDNFLESQKIEQESMNLSPLPTDIGQLIKETQEFLGPYAALKGVKFENHVPENLPLVKADQERLREALTNIYSNALRFSPQEGRVTTVLQEREKFLEVKITDQGPGIPEEELPHLFEKFYRPQSPKLRAMAGTGLGLYITRRIVEAHGGEIGVESAEGQGTTIRFTLPK
ncbi:MAG: PAS domain S-box protein, partial [bacterium]